MGWDKGLKLVKKLEQVSSSPNAYVYQTWCKSVMGIISEREFLEKRTEIIEDNCAYLFGFAAPHDYIPEQKKVIRCVNYLNVQTIEEKNDYWLFTTYSQSDLKMPIPESFLNFTLPMKFNGWFEEYTKFISKLKTNISIKME